MPGLPALRKEERLKAWTPGTSPILDSRAPFTPVFLSGTPRPHTPFPLPQKKQRRKRQEPFMVQANPDASLRPRRPWRREMRLAGDSGAETFLVSPRSGGLRGRVSGRRGRGLKGSDGRLLAEP